MITDISKLDPSKLYTYADYLTWQFDGMVELIKGKVFDMSPASSSSHQKFSIQMIRLISNFLEGKNCEVFHAPFDVRITSIKSEADIISVVQPDICVICDLRKIDERSCNGSPDLIIEIVSPNSIKRDVQDKLDIYQEVGVKEYWIAYPLEKMIEVFLLEGDRYQLVKKYVEADVVLVNSLPGLEIPLSKVFVS